MEFSLQSLLSIGIYLIYRIMLFLKDYRVGDPIANFLDFISISNISILVFDSRYHGYYLHGQNNAGSSEGEIDYLRKSLLKEGRGILQSRGLMRSSGDSLQSFELFMP